MLITKVYHHIMQLVPLIHAVILILGLLNVICFQYLCICWQLPVAQQPKFIGKLLVTGWVWVIIW